jgi:hypothetical protein
MDPYRDERDFRQEVATMENFLTQRPSALPAAVRPPLSAVATNVLVVPSATRAQLPQVHPVPVPAQMARIPVSIDGGNGTTGFNGSNGTWSAKQRMTDGARGVPPRGRPV